MAGSFLNTKEKALLWYKAENDTVYIKSCKGYY
jgi:hypothetical protein